MKKSTNPPNLNSVFSFPELAAEFIARPQNQEVVEGEKAEFSCSVSKDTYEVKWFRGDKEIEAGDKYSIISEGKRRALIVKSCELKDEGGYTAHIGTVKAVADLLVIGKTLIVFVISYYRDFRFGFIKFEFYFRKTEDHNSDQRHRGEGGRRDHV